MVVGIVARVKGTQMQGHGDSTATMTAVTTRGNMFYFYNMLFYLFVLRCAPMMCNLLEGVSCRDSSSEETIVAPPRRQARRTTTRRTTTRRPLNMGDDDHMNTRNQSMMYTQGGKTGGSSRPCPGSLDNCIDACPASPVSGHSSKNS